MIGSQPVRGLLLAALILAGAPPRPATALDLTPPAPRIDLGLPHAGAPRSPQPGKSEPGRSEPGRSEPGKAAPPPSSQPGKRQGGDPRRGDPQGNPLWAIPLSTLSATRERPIFSPSRRPPPRAEDAEALPDAPETSSPDASSSAAPSFSLVGTITGPGAGFGLFHDTGSDQAFRLRTGDTHDGWTLKSVEAQRVTLGKDGATATLSLPAREGGASASTDPEPADTPPEDAGAAFVPESPDNDATATEAEPPSDARSDPTPQATDDGATAGDMEEAPAPAGAEDAGDTPPASQ
ncbi:RodZ family helix-turn-helix domain-containing protein [Xanthobacter agilis]|uniref:General secretion pathway protein N n=1 Tax=Xanthobacter agilis TaxID=47492 RepID=A0ABU0L849_XANAG|nr:hypothetical protein [Xanthobacter agilis]MDQ0503334.1 general secretion pathway protein N [Xanthobacter agilis]